MKRIGAGMRSVPLCPVQMAKRDASHTRPVHRSPFAVRRSPFAVRRSPFTVRRSPFAVRRSPFTVRRSAFAVQRSPFTVRVRVRVHRSRSPFTVRRSPFSVHRSPLQPSLQASNTLHCQYVALPAWYAKRPALPVQMAKRGALHTHASAITVPCC